MIIKAIIAKTKFGVLILDSDNEEFEEALVGNSNIDDFVDRNKELDALEKEPYGLYECELSWVEEDICIESYKNKQIGWTI